MLSRSPVRPVGTADYDRLLHQKFASLHARKAAQRRYGLSFTINDLIWQEEQIRTGHCRLMGYRERNKDGGPGARLFEMDLAGFRPIYPVYDPNLGRIVTYLRGPHEWAGRMIRRREQRRKIAP